MPQGKQVQSMFSGIAGRYDILNHVLSLGSDFYWWRRMARRSGAGPGLRFLDVAAGTGDSSLALARRGAEVVSTDFTFEMLRLGPAKFRARGRERLVWASVGADAQSLPFRSASFDGITICYGIRNVEDRAKAYREFLRVLKPERPAHHPGVQPAPLRLAAGAVRPLQPAHAAPDRRLGQRLPGRLQLPAGQHPRLPRPARLGRRIGFNRVRFGGLDRPQRRHRRPAHRREARGRSGCYHGSVMQEV